MQAIILAAGMGRRLGEYTKTTLSVCFLSMVKNSLIEPSLYFLT